MNSGDEQGDQPTAIHHAKLFAIGTPCNIMDGTFLIEGDTATKIASCTEKIQVRLSIVAHVGVVDLSLDDNQGLCSKVIPFNLCVIDHVKGL